MGIGKPPEHGSVHPMLPLPLVVMLTAGAFLAGHWSGRGLGPCTGQPQQQAAPPPAYQHQQQSALAAPGGQPARPRAAPPARLRDMGELGREFLESSGILALRPPLPPAPSGNSFYTVQPFQILSWWPRIVLFPNFIDDARADHIVRLARSKLTDSGLAWRPDETPDPNQDTRTSMGTFLETFEDPDGVLAWLEEKIAAVTMLPAHHAEAFNVLRYHIGAHYDSHMDTFEPREFGEQPSQRMATVLTYLSDVEEGGETIFKKEGRANADVVVTDYKSCEPDKFKYKPRKGDAVLFYSCDPDSTINPRSLHGGCPVIKGEKWVATKWIHNKPYRDPDPDE